MSKHSIKSSNRLTVPATVPKYQQLASHFREKLEAGVLRPGDRLPSLSEMQVEYAASRPTVERAHALLEKDGLITRRHGAGVFVRELRSKSTLGTIGLSGEGFSFNGYTSYWSQIMGGVREAASRAQKQLLILDEVSHEGWEKADGVLICDWEANKASLHRPLSLPVVSLLVPIEGVASVAADDYAGARQATQHLLDLGHQRIGFLHAVGKQPVLAQRMAGYVDALQAAGISASPKWEREIDNLFIYGNQIVSAARQEMNNWLENGWKETGCTALLCQNDETALGVIQALQAKEIKVPDDISVIGFDGTEFCEMTSPRLTSVEIPLRAVGAAAVEMLLQQIEADEVLTNHQILPTQLRLRESTTAPPQSL